MASQYFTILTDYGTRAIAHALSQGQPLQLAKFAVGDGNGQAVTPTASATALVHQTHIAPVSAVSLDPRNNKQVIVELTIPENVGGFYIREMGVFDAQNKLIAYANCPESFKPTESSGSGKVQVLRMILKVESSSAVTLSIDNSVIFVTRQQMTPKTITATTQNGFDDSGHSHEINKASTSQQGIVQLTNDTGLESESLALTAKAGKKLAQLIATVQLALNNYIPLNKRSSAVNSNDENNVATSKAVKTAYDKGVEAKNAADNANNNANGRVSKSGDSMNGMLTITGSSTAYRVNNYNWPKKIELSGDSVIGNEVSVIGFNNNGALHLGGKPNSSEFNVSIDETGLWVKGDVVTKSGASLNNAFMKTGGVITGDTSFKQGDWSGISFYNNSGRYVRIENNPHSSNSMLSFVYRESNGSNINVASLPRKNGNILLDSDISHATNGTNKEKVASEFALNELNKKLSTVIRKNYTKTIKGTNASFDNATKKNINLEGETIIHPDGKIEQIIHFKAFRVWWFYFEAKNNSERLAIEIPVPLWTAMPNKITNVTATFSRTESGGSFSFGAEAFEWWPPSWAFERQNNIKDRLWLYTIRHVGNQDEHIDLWVKVEGY
nr:phage tail protein [Haemophilus sp. SZY H36]